MRGLLLVLAGAAYVLLDGPGVADARRELAKWRAKTTTTTTTDATTDPTTIGDAGPGGTHGGVTYA